MTLKELKLNLSTWVEEAHQGNPIEITRYNQPYVKIVPAIAAGVDVGRRVGKGDLKPLFQEKAKGVWLKELLEDRKS